MLRDLIATGDIAVTDDSDQAVRSASQTIRIGP